MLVPAETTQTKQTHASLTLHRTIRGRKLVRAPMRVRSRSTQAPRNADATELCSKKKKHLHDLKIIDGCAPHIDRPERAHTDAYAALALLTSPRRAYTDAYAALALLRRAPPDSHRPDSHSFSTALAQSPTQNRTPSPRTRIHPKPTLSHARQDRQASYLTRSLCKIRNERQR